MLTLYSYPRLFGVADNNGYGLKVYAFLRLSGVPFRHEHIVDISHAPRGQLPYVVDDGEIVGDSATILAHLVRKHRLTIDAELTQAQRDRDLLITRLLDDLYWVMSYSRWKDDRYWPAFRDAMLREHPTLTEATLVRAREYKCAALPLPGHWPLPVGRRDGAGPRGPGRARAGDSGDGLRPRRAADEH